MAKARPTANQTAPAAQEQGQDNTTAQGQQDTSSTAPTTAPVEADAAPKKGSADDASATAQGVPADTPTGGDAAADAAPKKGSADEAAADAAPKKGALDDAAAAELAEAEEAARAAEQRAQEAIARADQAIAAMAMAATLGQAERVQDGRKHYRVISPLTSDRRYEIGDDAWLTDAEAAPLLGHTVEEAHDDEA